MLLRYRRQRNKARKWAGKVAKRAKLSAQNRDAAYTLLQEILAAPYRTSDPRQTSLRCRFDWFERWRERVAALLESDPVKATDDADGQVPVSTIMLPRDVDLDAPVVIEMTSRYGFRLTLVSIGGGVTVVEFDTEWAIGLLGGFDLRDDLADKLIARSEETFVQRDRIAALERERDEAREREKQDTERLFHVTAERDEARVRALEAADHEALRDRVTTDGLGMLAVFTQTGEHIDNRILAGEGDCGAPGRFFDEMTDDEAARLYRCAEALRALLAKGGDDGPAV